jgi:uncharacterized protein
VTLTVGGRPQVLERSTAGQWTIDGVLAAHLAGCMNLRLSRFTDTLSVRRRALRPGRSAEIQAVWVDVPGLDLQVIRQRHTRPSADRHRHDTLKSGHPNEITVDHLGVVVWYPGAFERLSATLAGGTR